MNKMKLIITTFLPMLVVSSLLLPIKSANSQPLTKNQEPDLLIKDWISKFSNQFSDVSSYKVVSSDKKNITFYWNGQFEDSDSIERQDGVDGSLQSFKSWIKGNWQVKVNAKLEFQAKTKKKLARYYSIKSVSFKIPFQYFSYEYTTSEYEIPTKYISEDYEIDLDSSYFNLAFDKNISNILKYDYSYIIDGENLTSEGSGYIFVIFLKLKEEEVITTPQGGKFTLGVGTESTPGFYGGFSVGHGGDYGTVLGGSWPRGTDFQSPSGYCSVYDDDWIDDVEETESSDCKAAVSFLDEEDTTREVSGAAADGESQVVIQISNLCDNISEKDIKITISESDGTLGKKEFKDGVFTQIWKVPENFVREGQNDDLETGKRKLDFQITIKGEEVAVPDFYLFKPPVVLVHGIWANAKSLNSMRDYLGDNYSERDWVDNIEYPNSLHFADNVATVGEMISIGINKMKKQEIAGLENPIVVKKADVVAHSMGGILTGLYIASNNYEDNINRLITIGTPHSGSELANFTLHFVYDEMTSEKRSNFFNGPIYGMFKIYDGIKRSFTEGAVEDLQVGSSAMEDYRKGWQNVQKVPPVYAIQGKPQGESPSLVTDLFAYGGRKYSDNFTLVFPIGLWYWDSTLDRSKWYFEGANADPRDNSLYRSLNIEAGLFGSKKISDFIVSLESQRGGCSAYDTIEVADHTTETDDSKVQKKVAELLNSSIDKFDKNGFSPPAGYPVPKVGTVAIDQETNSQSTYTARTLKEEGTSTGKLNITSPEEGKVFSPGDTVTVEVTYDGQPKNGICFLSQDGSLGVDDSAPYEFQFQIDEEFIGSMLIVVWAETEEGGIEEGSVEISIETEDKPESISITPSGPVYIERGSEVMLYVEGTYPDGVTRDITSHAAGTSYSSADSSIASVTEDGVITAVSVGETTITVENGVSAEYKVYVLSCNAKKISVSEKTLTLKREESKNVTVTLTGNDGCLSEGKIVTTSINKAGQKRITISSTSTAVDSNGQAVFTITANNKKTGKAKVTFGSGKLKKSLTVKVTK